MGTWILTADRAGARILEKDDGGKFVLVEEVSHPEGRLRDSELGTDEPGRTYDRRGIGRHSLGQSEAPHERAAADFARSLADKLRKARLEGRYGRLVLAAGPQFIGLLRAELDRDTASRVSESITKDLQHVPLTKLGEHIGKV